MSIQTRKSGMITMHSRTGFLRHLNSLNLPVREEDLQTQAEDMLYVFENIGMFAVSSAIVHHFDHYIDDESTYYKKIIDELWFSVDLAENRDILFDTAKRICIELGCHKVAEILPDD